MVSLLLESGANVDLESDDYCDEDGQTPLHAAAGAGQAGIVALLLNAGADARTRNFDYKDAIDGPIYPENDEREPEDFETLETESALDVAAMGGHVEVIRELTKREPSMVNAFAESTGYTALHYAAESGQLASVDALIEAGADVNAPDGLINDRTQKHNLTPLCVAVMANNRAVVDTLLSAGADANAPLLNASAASSLAGMIPTLLRRGVDVNTRRASDGNAPLHLAAMAGAVTNADALLIGGADETAVNDQGEIPGDVVGRACDDDFDWLALYDIQRLLENAPRDRADRAWSRRGFFVLCRVFQSRLGLGRGAPMGPDHRRVFPDVLDKRGCHTLPEQQQEANNTRRAT
eukprot:g11166.t1